MIGPGRDEPEPRQRSQLETLARSIFAGFFESELMQPGLPQVRLVIFAIAVLMFPATQVPLRAGVAYDAASQRAPEILDVIMWPHKLLFITLAMVGTAVVSLVIWDNVFPDRREAFVIGHLPIRTRTVVAARLIALAGVMGVIAVGSAVPSAILYGGIAGGFSPGGILRTVAAHFIATVGASIFAFVLLLSLQGILINLIPGRWLQRAMILLQFFFVVAALEALLFMHPIIDALEKAMRAGGAVEANWMLWTPAAWFLGLYEVLAGTTRPVGWYAVPAVAALAVMVPLAFGLYAFTYQRLTRRAVEARDTESVGGGVGREPLVARVAAHLTRAPIADAVCRFTVLTLLRSRKHRLLLTIFAGIGTTAAAMSVLVPLSRGRLASSSSPEAILPVGLVLIFCLVIGLRALIAIPAEPSANWMFKLSDAEDARHHLRGAIAALMGVGVIPVVVLLIPVHLFTLGPAGTVVHSCVLFAGGYLLAEIATNRFRRVPFTSAYAVPASGLRVLWPFWLIGFLLFCFTLSSLELAVLRNPFAAVGLVATIALAAVAVRTFREWDFSLTTQMLTFDDVETDALVTLELSSFRPTPASGKP